MKRLVILATLAIAMAGGVFAAMPAHAVNGLIGICESSAGNGHCWRSPSNFGSTVTDEWPRDIAGDPLQVLKQKNYYGTISSYGCPAASGILGGGTGVYAFVDANNRFIGAGYHSGSRFAVGEDPNTVGNSWTDRWAWTSTGVLVNCGDTGGLYELCHEADYTQLFTQQGCTATWSTVDP